MSWNMIALAPSGGKGERPTVAGRQHSIGRNQCQGAAAGALPEQEGNGRDLE